MHDVIMALREAEQRTQPPNPFDIDVTMRRGRRRARRRHAGMAGAGLAVAAAVGAGLVFGVAERPVGPADPAPPAETPSQPPGIPGDLAERPEELISLFAAPQRPRDELPDEVKAVANVDESTTRPLGEFRDTRFWAALPDPAGENPRFRDLDFPVVCTVIVTAGDWKSTGCGGWASPERAGPSILAGYPPGTAQLLPDGYRPSPDELAEWTFLAPNLAITDVNPDCPPLTPPTLPDGSRPGQPTLGSRESPDGSPAVRLDWTGPDSYVSQAIGDDPPAPAGPEGEPLTVRGADARLFALSPGSFAVTFEQDGCAYTLELGQDLTWVQARAYAESF